MRSGSGKEGLALRAEKVERSFALTLDRGGLRRTHVRGRENVQKRYFVHVAGYNLGLVMRQLIGAGTPKELAARGAALLWLLDPERGLLLILILPPDAAPDSHFLNGLLTAARPLMASFFPRARLPGGDAAAVAVAVSLEIYGFFNRIVHNF